MSKKENFTAGRVAGFGCAPGKSQSIYWDGKTPGLGLRVTTAGTKSYIFEAQLNGKTLRVTIGDERTWTISKAQEEATSLKAKTDKGIDPRQEKADKQAAAEAKKTDEKRKNVTVGDAWTAYVAARSHTWGDSHRKDHAYSVNPGGEPRTKGRRPGESAVTLPGLLHPLMSLRLADLTAARVRDWLETSNERGKTESAKCFRLLRAFINWCVERDEYKGIASSSVHAKREVRDLVQKGRAKKLALQREQLPIWFESVRKISNPTASAYLQTLLLTGARREELAQLRWSDCDFEWLSLHIKDKVSDDGRDIPMTPYVRSLLLAQPRRNEYVFSSAMSASGYLADPLTPLQKAMKASGLPNLGPHDLRRSFATLSEWSEVPAGVVAQIMGHSASAIAEKHYIVRPLDLLRMWHGRIEAWILEQAGIEFVPEQSGLRVVTATA